MIMSKQLGEFLQEEQQPFILEAYLLERGCSSRKFSSDHCVFSGHVGSFLKRSVSSGLKGNKTFIPNCSKLVKCLFKKLGSKENVACDDIFSSASSATIFNSCYDSDEVGDAYIKNGGPEEMFKQLSPDSVLEDTSSFYTNKNGDGRRRQQFQFSALLSTQRSSERLSICSPDSSLQYSRNMKILHKDKQLLLDCAREMVGENPSPGGRGPDELWEKMCDDVWKWSRDAINEDNTIRLVPFGLIHSAQQWCRSEVERDELGVHIADVILDDIRDEIIQVLVNLKDE